jgi:hypothetical protein
MGLPSLRTDLPHPAIDETIKKEKKNTQDYHPWK